MSERTYGILVRTYTPKDDEVNARVERALTHAKQVQAVAKEFPALQCLIFLVPMEYDCGRTRMVLSDRLESEELAEFAEVFASPGYHSCEVLNKGIMELWVERITHALIVSGKAMQRFTPATLRAVDAAFAKGAKVAGLATDELRDIVLSGRIQNTFAAWEIKALVEAGGFKNKTDVEEIEPLIQIAQRYGRCIAPIDFGAGALDIHASETARARHEQVMRGKVANQQAECDRLYKNFSFIQGAVMA